jgi:hypothetical protein
MPTDIWSAPRMRHLDCIDAWKPVIKAQNPLKTKKVVREEADKLCKENGDVAGSSPAVGRAS